MFDNDSPAEEFGLSQRLAFALAGTVALPSPFPATGQLFLGVTPRGGAPLVPGKSHVYWKLVHVVSPKQRTTRFFSLEDLRAVSVPGPEQGTPRVQKTRSEIQDDLEGARQRLSDAVESGVHEVVVYPDVVIYIPESAPVFMRVVYEFGVTAAESASRVSLFTVQDGPC